MTPAMIAAIGSAAAVIVSAIFTGLVQLQHNRSYHGQDQPAPPAGSGSASRPQA